jgi:hypothetical protein
MIGFGLTGEDQPKGEEAKLEDREVSNMNFFLAFVLPDLVCCTCFSIPSYVCNLFSAAILCRSCASKQFLAICCLTYKSEELTPFLLTNFCSPNFAAMAFLQQLDCFEDFLYSPRHVSLVFLFCVDVYITLIQYSCTCVMSFF